MWPGPWPGIAGEAGRTEVADRLMTRPASQVRRALQQMLFPDREFSWLRHVLIAVGLLTCINLLGIFAPNILGIFGVIGKGSGPPVNGGRVLPQETSSLQTLADS